MKAVNCKYYQDNVNSSGTQNSEHKCFHAGFTLIEVLIATTILAAIIYLATLSYSMFLDIWKERSFTESRMIESYRTQMLLRSSIESVYDYYVTDPANERIGMYYPFFKGGQDSMEFITLSSVFKKGTPAVARLKAVKTDGQLDVVYEEALLDQMYVKYYDSPIHYDHSLNVHKDIKGFSIKYYWMERTLTVEEDVSESTGVWRDLFSGKDTRGIPCMIEVSVTSDEGDTKMLYSVMAENNRKAGFFQNEF